MIERANIAAKPIIVLSQMLESMVQNSKPTRAESSDVANAVLDGTDVCSLSSETAIGKHPINAIKMMSKICAEAERCVNYRKTFETTIKYTPHPVSIAEAVAQSAVRSVQHFCIDLIIVITDTGNICRLLAKYRPPVPIFACCVSNTVIRNLQFVWGIQGYKIPSYQGTENLLQLVIRHAKELKMVTTGHKAVCIHSASEETPDESNMLKIIEID